MFEDTPKKDYLSAGRFAKAKLCGRLGRWLTDGNKQFAHSGFDRGNIIHALIQALYDPRAVHPLDKRERPDDQVYLEALEDVLPSVDEVEEIEKSVEKYVEFAGTKLKCIGHADLVGKDAVFEIKTGQKKEWHIWQVLYYKWALGKEKAVLIYPDLGETVDATEYGVVTDLTIANTWSAILSGEPTECSICVECPIRKDCPLWRGQATDAMLELAEVVAKRKELETDLAAQKEIYKRYIKPYEDKLKELEKLEEECRNKVIKEGKPLVSYRVPGAEIKVVKGRKKLTLPKKFREPSFEEDPDVYKVTIDKKKLLEKYGEEEETWSVRVKLD